MENDREFRTESVRRLLEIMARLRGDGGCPWDREQTHRTLKPYLIEECHEFLEAVDRDDDEGMREELGDILLQLVFHSRIAAEGNRFVFDDVAATIAEKMIRRHPHVFADRSVEDSAGVLRQWDEIKREEKRAAGVAGESASVLDGVPASLPALHKAQEVQKRVGRVGFDWPEIEGVMAKVREELVEVERALESGSREAVREEIGDLLFAVVNLSRFVGEHAEEVLNDTVRKFADRFRRMERELAARGRRPEDCTLEELDVLWEEAKRSEREGGAPSARGGGERSDSRDAAPG